MRAELVRRLFLGERGPRAADLGQEDSSAVLSTAHPAAPHQLRDLGGKRPLKDVDLVLADDVNESRDRNSYSGE